MADPQESPISQLLRTLGITREDLEKRSDQMRQFLTAENANNQRVVEKKSTQAHPPADVPSVPKSIGPTSSFTRSRSRASSYTYRDETPPITPVKSEPVEAGHSLRHFDSMEMVIERQRRQSKKEKKERRERERERELQGRLTLPPLPPSPHNASQSHLNLDSFMHSRVEAPTLPDETQKRGDGALTEDTDNTSTSPMTPRRSKYYRDHTMLSGTSHSKSRKEQGAVSVDTSMYPPTVQPQLQSLHIYPVYPQYASYIHPNPQISFSSLPVTPQNRRTYSFLAKPETSPLPPSSPPPASSPIVTPHRPVVNLVSSPGPMGPLPDEEEYDSLPYTLPPGPYSSCKPDLSYAALVGQAILSSPEHRLTLQEIYDWITIVYPHFKRGETTWMNSIRHVLSTTVCFRKVPRERSAGRTQWAIWDEDLECFEGGGFRKHLCKDVINSNAARDRSSKGQGKNRKRTDTEDGAETRKVKRFRKDYPAQSPSRSVSTSYFPATISAHPLFPPIRPTPHHQPYYESCVQSQPIPAGVIFPPLPAAVGYHRLSSIVSSSSSSKVLDVGLQHEQNTVHGGDESVVVTPSTSQSDESSAFALSSSSTSLPELTPNHSSSSPPLASSELATVKPVVEEVCLDDYITISGGDEHSGGHPKENTSSLLTAVKHWGRSPKSNKKTSKTYEKTLRPGIKLGFGGTSPSSDEDDSSLLARSKANKTSEAKKFNKTPFPPLPESPTLNRKAASQFSKVSKPSVRKSNDSERPTTPTPCTPPRHTQQLPISSVRTPLSSKGINPAALYSEGDDEDELSRQLDRSRTPRKRVASSGMPVPAPVTPRRLVFPANQNDSPFRTPAGGSIFSPFRTPGSRSIFDPHDPGALLDEELNRMGAGAGDSPAGLFGKGRGSLLYDSPGFSTSPGQYAKWW